MKFPKITQSDCLLAALSYCRDGFSVIPVQTDKRPYLRSWKPYQITPAKEKEIEAWWKKYPDANIAIVLPDTLCVLDIDDLELAQHISESDICQQTAVSRTQSGGLHIWLHDESNKARSSNLRHSLNIKADLKAYGGYVLVPPSVGYRFLNDKEILKTSSVKETVFKILGINKIKPEATFKEKAPRQIFKEIDTGMRNDTLTSLADTLVKRIPNYDLLISTLFSLNEKICNPPLASPDIEVIARSIFDKEVVSSGKKYQKLSKIIEQESPQIDWIWEGFLGKGFITLFSGLPKMGKTTLLFHLLRALQKENTFLGKPVEKQGRVLILTEEDKKLYSRRTADFDLASEDIWLLSSYDVHGMNWKQILGDIKIAVEEEGISLLIIDTLGAFWRATDENDATKVQREIDELKVLVQESDIAALVLFHLRKTEGDYGTAHRGSGALVGAVDIALEFRPSRTLNRRVISSRSRFYETPAEILIELEKGSYELLGDPQVVEKDAVQERFLEALSDEHEEISEIVKRMKPQPSTGTISSVAKKCRVNQLLDFIGEGVRGKPFKYKKRVSE